MIRAALLLAVTALGVAGCATPVSVSRANPREVQRYLTRSVLSAGRTSGPTENVLNQWDLYERFANDPEGALAELHQGLVEGRGGSNELFALAELSFVYADAARSQSHYLAAAVYAYAFLFPQGADLAPRRFDPRLRIACDLYNRSVSEAFAAADRHEVELRGGRFALPFGTLGVELDPAELDWNDRRLGRFVPVAELEVHGLNQRYRWPGIGAPLAATAAPADPAEAPDDFLLPDAKVPVTALLRMDGARLDLYRGWIYARLEIYTATDRSSVTIDAHDVPLEVETTSSLAYLLAGSEFWDWEIRGFLFGDFLEKKPSRLVAFEPYRPGRMPVVFVHGTASSPGRWAEMVNDLTNDPRLRDRFQFWFFFYDTGNPVLYSASILRESLERTLAKLDPQGRDPALQRMVVIGHSQGGLLTKLTAVDAGTALWEGSFRKPPDQLRLSPATRDLVRRILLVEPEPFVKRVVFIATPHHGAYVAGSRLAQWVARFVSLPSGLLQAAGEIAQGNPDAIVGTPGRRIRGSVHDMTPGNPFVRTLASLPVEPGVAAHSIIAVKGDGPIETGDDGVVEYRSAHVEGVDSELVVRSGHSVQGHPRTIQEVRRILLLHAREWEGETP
jgi:pimeloyl-ACP methyl ester carboxylesterase